MADPRWRSLRVTPDEQELLLPAPATSGGSGRGPITRATSARQAITSGAAMVVVEGSNCRRDLTEAGYDAAVYRAYSGPAGVVIASPDDAELARQLSGWTSRRPVRDVLVAAVRAATGRHFVTIGNRGTTTPSVVVAAGGEPGSRIFLCSPRHGGPRRRSVLLVCTPSGGRPHLAVKAGPLSTAERARAEQRALERLEQLELGDAVPRPRGAGVDGSFYWSAESAIQGAPLSEYAARHPAEILSTLDPIVDWFTRLAAATRAEPPDPTTSGPALRGAHRSLIEQHVALAEVPGVVVHGDVGTGLNVLIGHDGHFGVIDWETASWTGLPLTDLLPLVCTTLAAAHGLRDVESAAEYILRLCAGEESESSWLHAAVRKYCRALEIPLRAAGSLAALAWGHQASMRLVYEELLAETRGSVEAWRTAADIVAVRWMGEPRLGSDWPALAGRENT